MSFQPEMTPMHPWSLLASKMTQFALSGGNHHHLALFGPTETTPDPMALTKQPNKAVATSKHDRKEENDEGKHLLGVLREEEKLELEMPQIAAREHMMWIASPGVSPIPGPTHRKAMSLCPQMLPALISTWINASSCVPRLTSCQASPPHLLTSKPMCSDAFWLNFEPNMASLTPVGVSHHPDGDSPSPSGPPSMCLHSLGESSGLGESISQWFAMQEAGKDEMSSKMHGDASLCFGIEARVGEGPCGAESSLTWIVSPGGTPHCSLPPGPSRTDPESWALPAQPDVASATLKCNGNKEIGERKHLLGVLKRKVEQESGTSQIVAREQTSPFANHCNSAPASPLQVPSTQTLLRSSTSPPAAHLLPNMGHTSSPTSAPTRTEATQRAKGPILPYDATTRCTLAYPGPPMPLLTQHDAPWRVCDPSTLTSDPDC